MTKNFRFSPADGLHRPWSTPSKAPELCTNYRTTSGGLAILQGALALPEVLDGEQPDAQGFASLAPRVHSSV